MFGGDFADPVIVRDGNDYDGFATQSGGLHIQHISSPDLVHWSPPTEALPTLPAWVDARQPNTWAPSVATNSAGGHVLFFTAREAASGRQCIGVAFASTTAGPFTAPAAAPVVCQRDLGGSIDPDVVATVGGTWLLWKNDGNCCGRPSQIWSAPLDLGTAAVVGHPHALLSVDQPWEQSTSPTETTIEGPDLVVVAGHYYLFYSGNGYATGSYAVGYADCESPDGPCVKARSVPILASTSAVAGPGGSCAFTDSAGGWWIAYHAWTPNAIGYDAGGLRTLRIDRLRFVAGLAVVDGPTAVANSLEP